MRPIIDKDGARLVDDQGRVIPGVRTFSVHVDMDGELIVSGVEFVATQDGKPLCCRPPAAPKA